MQRGMAIAIQVISSHPLLTLAVGKVLARARDLRVPVLSPASTETEAFMLRGCLRLFLLDACTLRVDLGPLAARCRANSPGSKFLALLPPLTSTSSEKTRLFYWGIDGFVELHKSWQTELPHAIHTVLNGGLWVPPEVLTTYVNQVRALLSAQRLSGQSLTARETQVLQLLMRHLTNRQISSTLRICERTVKFHVSNILSKLNLEDRRGLLPDHFKLGAGLPHSPAREAPALHH